MFVLLFALPWLFYSINKWLNGVALYKILELLLLDKEFNVFTVNKTKRKLAKIVVKRTHCFEKNFDQINNIAPSCCVNNKFALIP